MRNLRGGANKCTKCGICVQRFSYSDENRFFFSFHFHHALLSFYVEERKKLEICFGKNLS